MLIIMSVPGQKRGTCGHVMALLDSHRKCARCRDKGVGDDPCVKKMDFDICKAFMPAQINQLSTLTYQSRKEREQKKSTTDSPASATPTHVDPSEVTLLGQVHKESASAESPASKKKKRADESPKTSSRKKSSKSRSDDIKELHDKWAECFARLEAMLVSKTFAVSVEPVKKPSSVVTSDQPIFDPGTSTSGLSSSMPVESTGSVKEVLNKSVTRPVEGPGTGVVIQQNATQPVEAPGAGTATQPVEASGAGPDVLPTGTSDAALQSEND